MLGKITSFDETSQSGTIQCADKFYPFHLDDWHLDKPPLVGADVDFMPEANGVASNITSQDNIAPSQLPAVKSRIISSLLGLFFGWLGLHRIYLGFYSIAAMQIALTVAMLFIGAPGFAFFWGFIEGFLLFRGMIAKDGKGRPLK